MITTIMIDKDGTLLDFEKSWSIVIKNLFAALCRHYNLSPQVKLQIKNELGITNSGFTPDSLFIAGTSDEIIAKMNDVLKVDYRCLESFVAANLQLQVNNGELKLYLLGENVIASLKKLKQAGFKLVLVTADDSLFTNYFLSYFKIEHLFTEVYHNDLKLANKPASDIIDDYCQKHQCLRSQIIMVGDTYKDYYFYKNNDLASFYLVANSEYKQQLIACAIEDFTFIKDISKLPKHVLEAR